MKRPQINKLSNSSLLAKVVIDGQEHKLMVDTGSSSSLLSINVVNQILGDLKEVQPTDASCKLTTADGTPLDIIGKIDLQFFIGDQLFEYEFLVANIDLPGILGLDFLEQFDIVIKVASASLQIGDKIIELEREDSVKCARVKLSKRAIVPPESEMVVKGYVKGQLSSDSEVLLEPYKTLGRKGLLVSNSLVQPNNVVLSLVNVTKKPIYVKQHSLVGSLKSVDSTVAFHSVDDEKTSMSTGLTEVPEHLQNLIKGTSDNLTNEQQESLKQLIVEYQDIFVGPDGKLGRTDLVKHTIDTGIAKPIKVPPRRVPQKQKQLIEQELDKMLQNDIIEPSTSPWSSPILLVTKKDGSIRFCIDYRRLNAVTIKDAYPLPRMDDSLDALSGSKWFSTLDLASGYWQAEISESDRPKTAFSCHKGLFQFKVLPFGLSNAPAVFERLMELVLRGLNWEKCLCYLDDVIIFGKTFQEALENLKTVFQRFRQANLRLKPSKCTLFQTKVSFLGHIVSEAGISCDLRKTDSVKTWPVPTNVSEVKTFLGLVGYYRRFIRDFSTLAYPLTELTHKARSFIWTEACQIAFETLKSNLVSAPILAYTTENGTFVLDTDASLHGIGAVLSQIQNGEERVIAYASRTLSKSQQRYCTTYRELLAVVTFIKLFRHYLWGRRFVVRSDHSSLKWLRNFKNPEGMIARWLSVLSTYDFSIEFRRGSLHTNADAMSRKTHRICKNPSCPDCVNVAKTCEKVPNIVPKQADTLINKKGVTMPIVDQVVPAKNHTISDDPDSHVTMAIVNQVVPAENQSISDGPDSHDDQSDDSSQFSWIQTWSDDQIKHWQKLDPDIGRIVSLKSSHTGQPPRVVIAGDSKNVKSLWSLWDSLIVENGILRYIWHNTIDGSTSRLLVTPPEIRKVVFQKLHSDKVAGHFGRRRTIDAIRKRFFWPGMSSHIRLWVRQCDLCARRKPGPGKGKSPLQQSKSYYPLSRIAIDILECPQSTNGNSYIIVVCDYFTKWAEAYPVQDHTALTVADTLVTE